MIKKLLKFIHHHTMHKPHIHLAKKINWYKKWHEHRFHSHIHGAIALLYVTAVTFVVVMNIPSTNAAYQALTKDFLAATDFVFDELRIDLTSGSAKLKAQNYIKDDDTSLLLHLDEESGTVAADDSDNENDATLHGDSGFFAGNLNNSIKLDGRGDYLSIADSPSLSLGSNQTIEAWVKLNSVFDINASRDQGVVDKGNYRLYFNQTSGRINYEIENNNANYWTKQAGGDVKNSWDQDGKTAVRSSAFDGENRYVGLGLGVGDAEVWKYDGSSWTKIGGDGINNSWPDLMFEDVNALVVGGGYLFAGLGTTPAGDGEVWQCNLSQNCSEWTKIGGDGINSGWQINMFEAVYSLDYFGGYLYAGLGASANDAEVWRWDGFSWTKIGGDSLNSGWTTNYEFVRSLANDGINLYAGLGQTAGDGEVWRWNGSSWALIGGDGVNSSWTVADNIEYVSSLYYLDGNLYAGTGLTAGDGDLWMFNGSFWTKIGGDGLNSGWIGSTYEMVASIVGDGTNIYAGLGSSNGDGEVWSWDGSSWTKIGGDGLNGGWTTNQGDGVFALSYGDGILMVGLYDSAGDALAYEWDGSSWTIIGGGYVKNSWGFYNLQSVESSTTFNDRLYVGTGVSVAGNAMVWEFDGQIWNIVGGQGVNNSWDPNTYENVFALQTFNGYIYAGLGTTANDAEVWRYNGSSWEKIGGDGINDSWGINFESVYSLAVYDGALYAGLGASANDAEVWRYDGTSWTKIGGDSLNGGWTTNYEEVFTLRSYDGFLIAGLGNTSDDAEVWRYDGSSWTMVGGDDLNSSWSGGTYERVRSMAIYNGELYVGIGDTAGDGEVWRWNGSIWTQVGGDNLNGGWSNSIEYVSTLIDYRGKLYAGTGVSGNADAMVWSYGNNAFLSSNKNSHDTNWHHIAATYNGSEMKLFIDGVEDASASVSISVSENDLPLYVGATYGSGGRGESQGYLEGQIDEVRLSSIARTEFITSPYPTASQTITLASALFSSGIKGYLGFETVEDSSGGVITYRLSSDDGDSWLYWDGSDWALSDDVMLSNSSAVVDANISSFPVTFDGIKWQAILGSNGSQNVSIDNVTVEADTDTVRPNLNASNIVALKTNGGQSLSAGSWTNSSSPYFSWDVGNDVDAGIAGYCLYVGQDNTSDLTTTGGLFGDTLMNTGGKCAFATSDNFIDFGIPSVLSSQMTTSNDDYYLLVQAIDKAGNRFDGVEEFNFRFDNTPPMNPGFISAPSGFVSTKDVTFSWPTNGLQAASDGASGLAGLQYKINDSNWYGDIHNGNGDNSDLLVNDGVYQTIETPDYANIIDGINTVYFRTWDNAGNISSGTVNAVIKMNTNGAPSEPQNLIANPQNSNQNNFSFSWDAPSSFVGDEGNLNYCYTINTLPSVSTCNYTGAGITSLSAGPYATQPGQNIIYIVARDESNSINYSSYSSVIFSANTSAPGLPHNVDIVDVSIKATNNWRLAITWEEPIDSGVGVSQYKIYRSINGINYTLAGTSTSTTYIDSGLFQFEYSYYVTACDSTNNCSANSVVVSMLPTGKFIEPAEIIGLPEVSNVTTRRATVRWTTERSSDSKVSIGVSSGVYSPSEIGSSEQTPIHQIDLDNLVAGTTYYLKAKWTDEDGNTGISQEFTFTTSPAPIIKEVESMKVTLSSSVIKFTSIGANRVNLYYGESDSFGGLQSINTASSESTYFFDLSGLKDGTKYYYKLSSFDSEGSEYGGNIFSFTTPPRPRISNLRFQPVEGEPTSTQSVIWNTNVPSSSTVTYGKIGTGGIDLQISKLVTEHQMTISGLEDDSEYFLLVQSRDGDGNLAVSDTQRFKTALDTRPPVVSEINLESSIRGTGSEARGQVIVSWKTDEPSTSQVAYAEGSSVTVFNNKTSEDIQLTTEHIVVISNLPTSKVYSIQVVSYDKSRNVSYGETQSAIIGRANDSVLTVVLNALQRIFGL